MKININYIGKNISQLSTIPVRIYKGKTQDALYFVTNLPVDPIIPYADILLAIKEPVSLYITPDFHYYGIITSGNLRMILGPSSQIKFDQHRLAELAFKLGVAQEQKKEFMTALQLIPSMPIDSFIQILCLVNYIWNEEQVSVGQVLLYDHIPHDMRNALEKQRLNMLYHLEAKDDDYPHNTFAYEQTMLNYVRRGDLTALETFFTETIPGRSGKLSNNQVRQHKNSFIVTTTLVCRSAIRGGMLPEEAFSLSDAYIQQCDILNNITDILTLEYHMVMDYAKKVYELRKDHNNSPLVLNVKNYIRLHLSETIRVEDIARALCISRSHLSEKFRQETGLTLINFITAEKIEESRNLLSYTNKPISAISNYLGFSSQSHFQNIFRKMSGMTPRKYRELYTNRP